MIIVRLPKNDENTLRNGAAWVRPLFETRFIMDKATEELSFYGA